MCRYPLVCFTFTFLKTKSFSVFCSYSYTTVSQWSNYITEILTDQIIMLLWMLIMTVAPLASIVRLMMVLYDYVFSIETQSDTDLSLMHIINKVKSKNLHDLSGLDAKDVEEIIRRHFHVTSVPGVNTFLSVANPNTIQVYTFQSDLRSVLLWLVVFFVLVIIPGFIMLVTMLSSNDQLFLYPGQEQIRRTSIQRKSRSTIRKLMKRLDQYQMVSSLDCLILIDAIFL